VNLIVRPRVYEKYQDALRNAPLLLVEGQLQWEGRTVSGSQYCIAPMDHNLTTKARGMCRPAPSQAFGITKSTHQWEQD
jgi:hypothetical protein